MAASSTPSPYLSLMDLPQIRNLIRCFLYHPALLHFQHLLVLIMNFIDLRDYTTRNDLQIRKRLYPSLQASH